MKKVLFIGGTDPCGGAGIQADLRSAQDLGAWGLSVVTSVVAQNTSGVFHCHHLGGDILEQQLDSIQSDVVFDAIKIGMMGTTETMNIVSEFIKTHSHLPIVLDPIQFDGSGKTKLASDTLFQTMLDVLGEHVNVITPNADEAFAWSKGELAEVLADIHSYGPDVLLKSGHIVSDSSGISDYFFDSNGLVSLKTFPRRDINPRGTGCHLASAIAVGLAQGRTHKQACEDAREWLAKKFESKLENIGKGRRLIR